MICYAEITCHTDLPYWLPYEVFLKNFDQHDFLSRDCAEVQAVYLSAWFDKAEGGVTLFKLPTVQVLSGGNSQFINGRHRTAVLFKAMDVIPIAFTIGKGHEFAERLGLKMLYTDEKIVLPDLPIKDVLDTLKI